MHSCKIWHHARLGCVRQCHSPAASTVRSDHGTTWSAHQRDIRYDSLLWLIINPGWGPGQSNEGDMPHKSRTPSGLAAARRTLE